MVSGNIGLDTISTIMRPSFLGHQMKTAQMVWRAGRRRTVELTPAARIKAPFAAPSKLRNTLPPLASNDLLLGGRPGRQESD